VRFIGQRAVAGKIDNSAVVKRFHPAKARPTWGTQEAGRLS
jgi:hypothetical protein